MKNRREFDMSFARVNRHVLEYLASSSVIALMLCDGTVLRQCYDTAAVSRGLLKGGI